jgi:hypothetical protein
LSNTGPSMTANSSSLSTVTVVETTTTVVWIYPTLDSTVSGANDTRRHSVSWYVVEICPRVQLHRRIGESREWDVSIKGGERVRGAHWGLTITKVSWMFPPCAVLQVGNHGSHVTNRKPFVWLYILFCLLYPLPICINLLAVLDTLLVCVQVYIFLLQVDFLYIWDNLLRLFQW